MKALLLATAIAFFASSCEDCGECTSTIITTSSVPAPGYPDTTEHKFEACDDELSEWDGNMDTTSITVNGITATSLSRTECD